MRKKLLVRFPVYLLVTDEGLVLTLRLGKDPCCLISTSRLLANKQALQMERQGVSCRPMFINDSDSLHAILKPLWVSREGEYVQINGADPKRSAVVSLEDVLLDLEPPP